MRTNEIDSATSHFKAITAEKRKHRRISLYLPTEYFPKGSSITRFGHTINTCEEGVVICIREKYEVGQNLRVRFFFNMDSDCVSIESQTKIVWRDNLEQKGKEYVYGLRFIEMSDGDMKKLKIFLKSYSGARQERKWPGLLGWVKEGGLAKKR